MRALMFVAVLLPNLVLAGCADPAATPEEPSMSAPRWEVGDWWVHRSVAVGEGLAGEVRTEVVAIDVVDGEELYRVRVSGNFTDSPEERYYTRDLNRAWLKWGGPCGELPGAEGRPCTGGDRWLEWPLREGASWEFVEGRDISEGGSASVSRANHGPRDGGPSYVVTFRDDLPGGLQARVMILSPEAGWYTLDARYGDGGEVRGLSVLVETNYA